MIRLICFFVKLAFPRKSVNQINGQTLKLQRNFGPNPAPLQDLANGRIPIRYWSVDPCSCPRVSQVRIKKFWQSNFDSNPSTRLKIEWIKKCIENV